MNIKRRKFIIFISSSFVLASSIFYLKKKNDRNQGVEEFLKNYNTLIFLENLIDQRIEDINFEESLKNLILTNGLSKTKKIIDQKIKDEYKANKIKLLNQWIVSETEFNLLILKYKYV